MGGGSFLNGTLLAVWVVNVTWKKEGKGQMGEAGDILRAFMFLLNAIR